MLHNEKGILHKVYPVETGQTKNGIWSNQRIIIQQQYGNSIVNLALKVPARNLEKVAAIKVGSAVEVSFIVDCREYKERWYTELVLLNIEPLAKEVATAMPATEAAFSSLFPGMQMRTASPSAKFDDKGESEDLPF